MGTKKTTALRRPHLAAMAALLAAAAPGQEGVRASAAALRAVEDFARELVRAGHLPEAEDLLVVLRQLGMDMNSVGRARDKLNKEKRGVADGKRDSGLAPKARRVAAVLLPEIARQTGEAERRAVARIALRFDGDLAGAHEALGRSQVDGVWSDAGDGARQQARRAFAAAVLAARALEFAIEAGPSQQPLVTAQVKDHGGCAKFKGFELHTFEGPAVAATMLRQALRTAALVHWLYRGDLEVPVQPAPPTIMTGHRARYLQAIDDARAQGKIDDAKAEAARHTTVLHDPRGSVLFEVSRDEMVACWAARQLAPTTRSALDEGVLNLACELIVGCFEGIVEQDQKHGDGKEPADWYTAQDADDNSYYAYAGSLGARHFLATLGDRSLLDPAQLLAIKPGATLGLPHIQGTVGAAWLVETGKVQALLTAAAKSPLDSSRPRELAQSLLGADAEWSAMRAWLEPDPVGMAQQFAAAEANAPLRRAIDAARKAAIGNVPHKLHATATWSDRLDRGCSELLTARAGGAGTALGAEVGMFAVTAAGPDLDAALRAMITSVAGRAALFDIGTLEIGAAFQAGVLAVDCGSLRHPVMTDAMVLWPSPGAADVPTRYLAGLPVPEPGVDPAAIGYPLTLQLGLGEDAPRTISLRVCEADKPDAWLPCYRFDPERPLAGCEQLLRTYGILPQAPLKPRTRYAFVVQIDKRDPVRAGFTTGN